MTTPSDPSDDTTTPSDPSDDEAAAPDPDTSGSPADDDEGTPDETTTPDPGDGGADTTPVTEAPDSSDGQGKDDEAGRAVTNEFEATGTHGATYDEETKQVTFFVNSDDQFYSQINIMWYKEYDSYASAAKNHIKNDGNFITGVGAESFTEADGKKTVTKSVTEGTGAILYYINGEGGHDRLQYEHIIVIDPDAEPGIEDPVEPTLPKKPDGLIAEWISDVNSAEYRKIKVAWALASVDLVTEWKIAIDDKDVITLTNDGTGNTAVYYAPNIYAAGTHTASLVASNSVGDSEAATVTFTLTAEQAGLQEPKEKNSIIVSEQLAQAKAGETVTLAYVADNEEFTFTDYTVELNGTAVEDQAKITVSDGSVELDGSLFPDAGVYKIQFEKEGFHFSPVYQVVYATDAADSWDLVWNDEFGGTSLDTTKWDYQTGNGSAYGISGWGNEEVQIYTDSDKNTTVGDGKLTITGRKEGDGYTSARLRTVTEEITDGKAAVGTPLQIGTYGKIEAKIKMPAGEGIWPAFWMLPHDSEYGTWAASGEIDIMEARGRLPKEVCGTIHYGDVWPNNSSSGESYHFQGDDSIEQYHLYTYEWDPTAMRWYVDGKLYSTITNWYSVQSESGNYPYPAPFDEEFYILLNVALGGNFDSGATKLEVDENGVDMDVDYVRWYQRTGGYDDWEIKQPETEKDTSEEAQALLATADANGNFIKDSDFAEMSTEPYTANGSWEIKSGYWAPLLIPDNGNGSAAWSKTQNGDKNYLKVAVNSVGSQTYSSQMLQYFPVIKGYSYEVSYSAYTDAAKQKADISLKIGGDDDNGWTVYSGNYADQLTTTPTTYTHKFTMSAVTDPTARFEFNLATSAGNVYLSDVTVKIIDGISEDEGEDDDKEPLVDGNHVYNGGFSNGTDGLLYWHWGTSDEPEKVSVVKEDKERKAEIKASASAPVSMWQYGINLLQTDEYILTFDIDSTAEQNIELKVTNQDGTESYASDTKSAAAGASKVEWEFTQPEGKTDTSGKLTLTFNGNAKIDNVRLVRTTFNNVDYDQVDLYPLANGDFSDGLTGWNIWHEGATWETHKVNDEGQLELNDIVIEANQTFYCVGIKSPSMTLTKGVKYKVTFDYTLPEAKTYTLELCGIQKEITLEGGTHTYESEAFPGNGSGEFALYLGPYPATNYTFILDNVVVAADLPEKEGYYKPVILAQDGKVKLGSDVVITYAGDTAEREEAWGNADKTYYLAGKEIDADKVNLDTAKKTITLDSSLFTEDGEFAFYVEAEGYTDTKVISLTVLDASGNLLSNGNFSSAKAGWSFYMADWEGAAGGSFEVNEEGIAVVNHQWDSGEDWHFQLYQDLDYAADDYVVTFDAWADVERPINVHIQPDSSSPAFANANSFVNLSTSKKSYKIIWKGLSAASAARFDIAMGSMTYDGVTSPNDGKNPYNIYLDNIVFRPLTAENENTMPATIASAGAGKAGTDDVTVTYTKAIDAWKNAAKTVYVNGEALDAGKVTDNTTSLVIDKSVFAESGRYAIYIVAEGFEETNTIYKTMLEADNNLILGGDMSDASQWTVYDEDEENLSHGRIVDGKYVLDYQAGYYREDGTCWVTWSSQLKKENVSVESGKSYTILFEAYTDLEGGRDIIFEHAKATAGDGQKTQVTAHIDKGYGVYAVTVNADGSYDDYVINMLLGPVGSNLQVNTANGVDNQVPHRVVIDNVTMLEAGETNKIILEAALAEYEDRKEEEAVASAYEQAKAVLDNDAAAQSEINEAVVALRQAGGEPEEGDKQTVSLVQEGKASPGLAVVVKYSGEDAVESGWAGADKKYYLDDVEIAADKVTVDTTAKTITLDASLFPRAGVYQFYIEAEGYAATQEISLTILDEDKTPATIASPGSGQAGADDVTITYVEAGDEWKNASKTVYVNETAVDAEKVTDTVTELVIDKSVFTEVGTYSIYIVAEGFEATNTIQKEMQGDQSEDQKARKALEAMVEEYRGIEQYVSGEHAYTDASYEEYTKALQEAVACLADENADKARYDSAKAALESAVRMLKNREGLWAMEIADQTYTGAKLTPAIEVWHGYTRLTNKKDYTVAYRDNTNATGVGKAAAVVTGKGNFKGKAEVYFNILPKNLGDADISSADVYAIAKANGKVADPKVTVKFGKKTLKNGTDYSWEGPAKDADGKIAPGSYEITISAKKADGTAALNYTGSRTIGYEVRSNGTLLMSKAKITLSATKVDYAGIDGSETVIPKVTSVRIGSTTLTKDVDYTVSERPENWNRVGKATITVAGKEGTVYYGSKSVTYTVNGTKLAAKNLEISGINPTYDYTGKPIYVSANDEAVSKDTTSDGTLKVKTKGADAKELKEGTDYTVSYKTGKKDGEHTNVGTVTVTITGINAYTGTVKKTFKITAFDLANYSKESAPTALKFEAEGTAKYTKTGAKPAFTLRFNNEELVEKKDYTVSYTGNSKVRANEQSATMTIKGKGNFKGNIPYKYEVTIASAADAEAAAADIVMPGQFKKLKTTVKVVEKSTGKTLKAGTDYEKSIKYYSDAACEKEITADTFSTLKVDDTVYAKVVMKGNYIGTGTAPGHLVAAFRLYANSNKIADGKKYIVKVDTGRTAVEGETIDCDSKGNPIYTGAEIRPKVTVTPKGANAVALEEGKDYVVTYSNNINKGKATATVTGIGTYGGTKSVKFTIVSTDMKWNTRVAQKIAAFFSNLF